MKDLLSLLSLLADHRAMGLVRTGCMPDSPRHVIETTSGGSEPEETN